MPDDPIDVESYLDPVPVNRVVRGGQKLQGVQPELLTHWNNLQNEFGNAGLTPEIKSGYRTAAQQQALYNNPATRARTKGNDGIVKISPHQEGRALDISFNASQRDKGRQIIANYARANGLTVPSDEPWHIAIPRQSKPAAESYLDPQKPATPSTAPNVEDYLDPQPISATPLDQSGVKSIPQPKEQVTSSIREADTGSELPSGPTPQPQPVAPVQFTPTTGASRTTTPTELMTNLLEPPQEGGTAEEKLTKARYKTPPSTELGQAAKIPFSPHLNPIQDDIVTGYLNALGPEYAKYGEKYKQDTGRNILALSPDDVDRDKEGNIYVRPTRAAVDVLNAYVKSGGDINAAKAEGARIAEERRGAVTTAEQQAVPDIAEVQAARTGLGTYSGARRSVESPLISYGGAKLAQLGGLLSGFGIAPTRASDYLQTRGRVMELGANSPPLTPAGEEVQRSVPEKVATGLTHLGLGVADIVLLKKGTGLSTGQIMALESLAHDTDLPAAQRAQNATQAYAMGRILDGHLNRAMSGAIFGVPTAVESAQQVAKGQKSKTDALIDTLIQGGTGAILGGGKESDARTSEVQSREALGIERAAKEGLTPEEREAKVQPYFLRDDQGNPVARVLNPDEVAAGTEKMRVRAIHPADTAARDEGGRFAEKPEVLSEPLRQPVPEQVAATEAPLEQPTEQQKLPVPQTLEPEPATAVSPQEPLPAASTPSPDKGAATATIPKKDAANARRILDAYDNTGDLSTEGEVVDAMEQAKLLPESVAAYRAAVQESRDVWGDRMDIAGDVFESEIRPKLEAIAAKTEAPKSAVSAEPSRAIDTTPILQASTEKELNAVGGRMVMEAKTKDEIAQIQSAMQQRGRELDSVPTVAAPKPEPISNVEAPGRARLGDRTDYDRLYPPGSAKREAYENAAREVMAEKTAGVEATGIPSSTEPSEASARPAQEPIDAITPVEAPLKTTGIAHRVETAVRGEEPPRGQAIGAQESVERGRQLLREGVDPQNAIDSFRKSGAISAESVALVRAKHEELAQAANRAFDAGGQRLDSPEFKAAEKARQDFYDSAVKPMQTAWSNTGRAQQGETAIDTGTFYGMYRAFKNSKTREPTPQETATMKNFAQRNAAVDSDVKNLSGRLAAELDKAAGIKDLPDEVQKAVSRFVEQAKRESRRVGRQATRKTLDDEAAIIRQNLAAAFQKVKSGSGIQPSGLARFDPEGEITKQIIAYAKNRVKAGVTDTAQLIDDVHGVLKDFANDVTRREVTEAILGQGMPKGERVESEWAKVKTGIKESVKAQDAKAEQKALGMRLQKGKISPEDAAAVWKYARENYVDQGNNDFANVRQKVASDLGVTPETVTRALANTKATRQISNEMWAKMSDRRQVRSNAESWIRQSDAPAYVKAFENARRIWFLKATVGHGAVAPFTHAPANAFIPSRWSDFWRNFGKTYQFMVSKGGHERSMTDLENSDNFITAQRAGLANDPKRGYDEYQSPWMAKALGKLGVSGNRAFDSLKTMRQDMFDSAWDGLTNDLKTPELAKALSQEINASTGASKALSGQDWPSRFASKAMFAAPLEASRWDFLVRDNYRAMKAFTNWKNATPPERYMAKRVASRNAQLVATYGALLAANQGLLSATKSDEKINVTDPTKSDFLAFKIGGHVVSPAGGMLTAMRFIGNLMSIGREDKTGKQKASDAAGVAFKYGRSKLSPLFGTGADVYLQSDYSGRPLPFSKDEGPVYAPRYTWPQYVWSTQTPIPIAEAARTYYDAREAGATKVGAVARAVPVGAVAGTGIRVREDFAPRANEEAEKKAKKASLIEDARSGRITKADLDQKLQSDEITKADVQAITKEAAMTPRQVAFSNMRPMDALVRYSRMSGAQKAEIQPIMERHAWTLTHSDALTQEQKNKYKEKLDAAGITAVPPKKSTSSFSRRFLSAP